MKNTQVLSLSAVLAVCLLYSCNQSKEGKDSLGKNVGYSQSTTPSLCSGSWFPHAQTPPPAEGVGSPFDTTSTTNAIFHQWSYQKFLWLTKPFGELPLFLNQDRLVQVTSHLDTVARQKGAHVVLTDTKQAGSSAVLPTNPAYSSGNQSETVYYSIHMNPTMIASAIAFKERIQQEPDSANNKWSFPVGALELKVSWVDTSAISSRALSEYFTTTAAVSLDGGVTYKNTKVAMLGMHVVGRVINHPEFIWATFEHDDLAPDYDWVANEASSTEQLLLFAEGKTTGIDGIKWENGKPKLLYKAFDLFQYGVPRNMGGSFMTTSQQEPVNFNNIDSINICVKASLKDVWKNYFYNGSIWMDTDNLTPTQQADVLIGAGDTLSSATYGSVARGSLNCANVTMETFTQTFKKSIEDIKVGNLANCFSCHNAVSFTSTKSPIYISHVFDAFIKRRQGLSFEKVEDLKAKQELQEFLKNSVK